MSVVETSIEPLPRRAARIGEVAAAPAADEVDRLARFPTEAVEAMRADAMLGALIPESLGGGGATVPELAAATSALARYCASTAMVFAMHQIQVACLVRHGHATFLREYLAGVAHDQLLLASATTEAGVGGDVRSSVCSVTHRAGGFQLQKQAPVISYGAHADAVLATARRTPDSPANDQVLVLCAPPSLRLEATSGWNTLGFRGTCSGGFMLTAEGPDDCILPDPYADISSRTMLPISHVLWASVWLGIATAAVERARHYVRAQARGKPGLTPPSAMHLAELMTIFQQMADVVGGATERYHQHADDQRVLCSMGFALSMNSLKVSTSALVVDIVSRALAICGMAGYSETSAYSMGRLLRDAHGAALMVNNDRILANNAQMLLVSKEL